MVRRIRVTYRLRIASSLLAEKREAIDRVMRVHENGCPVYRTISGCVDITTTLEIEET